LFNKKVTVINTGATLNFNHDNSDPLIDCDDDHKTAEKVLDDLKETFSAVSIIFSFLRIFNLPYLYEIHDTLDTDYFFDLYIPRWRPVTGFKIINDKFVNCYYYHYFGDMVKMELDVKQHEEFENIFLLACEKEKILKYLNTLEENLKNPFNVRKENILKLFELVWPFQW
ncbi:MAG: hypothetical protein LBJ32_01625, partial [Oscillospiraceae bacterium]|nr:hypothetical protein [Oscillospiraceae bacterium]